MPEQLDLTAAAAAPVDAEDRFEPYRRLHPGSKFVQFNEHRLGVTFTIHCPPGSKWYEMLDETQVVDIRFPE